MLLSSLCFYLQGPNTVTYGGGDSMNVVVFSVFLSSRAEYCYLRGGRQYECCCLLCVSIFKGRILLLTGGDSMNVVVFSVFLSSRAEYCYLRGETV